MLIASVVEKKLNAPALVTMASVAGWDFEISLVAACLTPEDNGAGIIDVGADASPNTARLMSKWRQRSGFRQVQARL